MSAINDKPAYPTQNGCRNDPGMSKREVIAKDALNGYLAGRNNSERQMPPGDTLHADVAAACLRYADALLSALAPVEDAPSNLLLNEMEVIGTIAGSPHHENALQAIREIASAAIARERGVTDYPVPLYIRDTPREATLRLERNLLAAALENYLTTETLEDLERLANSTTFGPSVPRRAQAQLQLRGALGVMTSKGE